MKGDVFLHLFLIRCCVFTSPCFDCIDHTGHRVDPAVSAISMLLWLLWPCLLTTGPQGRRSVSPEAGDRKLDMAPLGIAGLGKHLPAKALPRAVLPPA